MGFNLTPKIRVGIRKGKPILYKISAKLGCRFAVNDLFMGNRSPEDGRRVALPLTVTNEPIGPIRQDAGV
jgi:hypothetical protein